MALGNLTFDTGNLLNLVILGLLSAVLYCRLQKEIYLLLHHMGE